jgi:hypothetical protein
MGETRVDLLHLLEDLRDAYPGALEETILTEIIANSLDSGARRIRIHADPTIPTLAILDDGSGMQRRELSRYHDIAASTKTRGQGIGFAGVGIKLALLLCEDVVTETRRGKTHVATRWRLASRHKAPWKWETPAGRVAERGTAVEMRLANPLSPLLDRGYIAAALLRHFGPLLDPRFRPLLETHYPGEIEIEINGARLGRESDTVGDIAPIEVRMPRRRKASALGYLRRVPSALPEDQRGLAISTLGKVIRRGWDWLAMTPANPDRVGGVIEVPALAECLTLNKADFIRTGPRGATFLAYRKAIQEAVGHQLAAWGDARSPEEASHRRAARPLERDLERVLAGLSDDFPLIASLVERREGGQKRLPVGGGDPQGPLVATPGAMHVLPEAGQTAADATANGPATLTSVLETVADSATGIAEPEEASPAPLPAPGSATTTLPGTGGRRRPARYGLEIRFERQEGSSELGRLIESTVWVNSAHAAYERAVASRSEGYHAALSVAFALAPLAVEPAREREFVAAFLARWGSALRPGPAGQAGKRRSPRPGGRTRT